MKWALALVVVIGALAVGWMAWHKHHSRPPVQVVVRLTVSPADQVNLVMTKAQSARFKYLLGQIAGANPYLAQQLTLKAVPNSTMLEARVGAQNKEQAQRYAEAFVDTLQSLCGSQVQLALDRQTIR